MIRAEELDGLKARFAAVQASPTAARAAQRATLRMLPSRTRLRLRLTRQVDDAAYWLVCHDHTDAARRLYQITGLWHARTRRTAD